MCLRDQGLHKSYTNLSAWNMTQGEIFLASSKSQIWISAGPGHRQLVQSYLFLLGEGNVDTYLVPWGGSNIPPGGWSCVCFLRRHYF